MSGICRIKETRVHTILLPASNQDWNPQKRSSNLITRPCSFIGRQNFCMHREVRCRTSSSRYSPAHKAAWTRERISNSNEVRILHLYKARQKVSPEIIYLLALSLWRKPSVAARRAPPNTFVAWRLATWNYSLAFTEHVG